MLRTVVTLLMAVIFALPLLPVIIVLRIISLLRPQAGFRRIIERIAHIVLPPLLKIAGISFEVTGTENLPDEPAMYVGNHQGGFDAIVPVLYLGSIKSIVLKKEIGRIPFAGWALRLFGCVFLDRTNLKAQIACVREMEEKLRSGNDIAVFPEGTRSRGPEMGDFKAGAFRAAIAAGAPVVPFVIDGSWRCFEEHRKLTPGTVLISILPPVPTDGLKSTDVRETAVRIREIMQSEQFRLRAEKGKNNA